MHLVRQELVENKCFFFCKVNKRKSRKNGWELCLCCVLLLRDSWALVQLLHVSEQVEFALWPLFHLSLHLHSPYRKEKKHRTVSTASWCWGIFPEKQMWGTPEVLLSVNYDILIGGHWEVDVVAAKFVSLCIIPSLTWLVHLFLLFWK